MATSPSEMVSLKEGLCPSGYLSFNSSFGKWSLKESLIKTDQDFAFISSSRKRERPLKFTLLNLKHPSSLWLWVIRGDFPECAVWALGFIQPYFGVNPFSEFCSVQFQGTTIMSWAQQQSGFGEFGPVGRKQHNIWFVGEILLSFLVQIELTS